MAQRNDRLAWQLGAEIRSVSFDAVSINVDDGERVAALTGKKMVDAETVLAALANWWSW